MELRFHLIADCFLFFFVLQTQRKVQTLKETRDYTFLHSDDAELPSQASGPPKAAAAPAPSAGQSATLFLLKMGFLLLPFFFLFVDMAERR